MMSFLKSIRSNDKARLADLEKKLDEACAKIEALEKEVRLSSRAISALSRCVTAITTAVREMANDSKLIAETIESMTIKKKVTQKSPHWKKSKDDDLIN